LSLDMASSLQWRGISLSLDVGKAAEDEENESSHVELPSLQGRRSTQGNCRNVRSTEAAKAARAARLLQRRARRRRSGSWRVAAANSSKNAAMEIKVLALVTCFTEHLAASV